jgi:hypothetical protein
MADPTSPPTVATDLEGIGKIVLLIFGAGGLGKVLVALGNNIWDRFKKHDEHEYAALDRYEQAGWDRLKEEEELTKELRNELQGLREKLYDLNVKHAVLSIDRDHLANRNIELEQENERFRAILNRFNHPTQPPQIK